MEGGREGGGRQAGRDEGKEGGVQQGGSSSGFSYAAKILPSHHCNKRAEAKVFLHIKILGAAMHGTCARKPWVTVVTRAE